MHEFQKPDSVEWKIVCVPSAKIFLYDKLLAAVTFEKMINEQDDLQIYNYCKYCRIESMNLCFYFKKISNKETRVGLL